MGGVVVVFMYLTQTEKSTCLAKDQAITLWLISGAYVCATKIGRGVETGISPINPAISFGLIGAQVLSGGYEYSWGWVLLVFPFLGGIVALILFETVFKKSDAAKDKKDDD